MKIKTGELYKTKNAACFFEKDKSPYDYFSLINGTIILCIDTANSFDFILNDEIIILADYPPERYLEKLNYES